MKNFITKPAGYFLCIACLMISYLATAQSGYISDVQAVTPGACVQSTINGNNQFWDIAQGNTYTITLSGVTDCANGGTDATIDVIVKSSVNGNTPLTATNVGVGVYEFNFSLTSTACATMPILYCTDGNDPSTGNFAQDLLQDGVGHLRAAYFDGSCNKTSTDNDCSNPCTFTAQIDGDLEICASTTTELCVNSGVNWEWNTGSSDNCITVGDGGTYTVTVIDANGCSDEVSVTLTVNDLPEVTIGADGPTSFCPGGCVTLTASGADTYVWSPNGETTESILVCDAGDYSVVGTDANGCTDASDNTSVIIYTPPTVTVSPSNPDPVCEGTCVTLTASGADSYVWSPNGETTSSIEACETGTYSVVGTDANGCTDASDDVSVTVNPPPTVTVSPTNPDPVCEGICVTLTASGAVSYVWSPNGETTSSIEACEDGTYSVVGTDANGCTDASDDVSVTILPAPDVTITPSDPDPVCEGTCVTLTASGADSYVWSTEETTSSIEVCETGEYSVTGTGANGCTATAGPVTVTVNPNPSCSLSQPNPLPVFGITGNKLTATVECPEGCTCSYDWDLTSSDNSWIITAGENSTEVTYTAGNNGTTGSFTFTITCDGTGCSSSCEITVTPTALEQCTYTQGFYGNGGKTCNGLTAGQAIFQATNTDCNSNTPICNPIVIGYGSKTITFGCLAADTACTRLRLPGGGNSAVLANTSPVTCANIPSGMLQNGKLKNVLAGQTLALSISLRLSCGLRTIPITSPTFTTYAATACVNGNGIPGTGQTFTIPQSVITCLGVNNTIQDLLNLANKRLGGVAVCTNVSLDNITAALDAVNRGFDKCRVSSTNTIREAGSAVTGGSENLNLSVYPNPTNADATVEFISHEAGKAVIDIIGMNGAIVSHLFESDVTSNTTNQIHFDTNDLLPGIYFIRVTTGNESAYSRLVVIR